MGIPFNGNVQTFSRACAAVENIVRKRFVDPGPAWPREWFQPTKTGVDVRTSGSSGEPKRVHLTFDAVRASAQASAEFLAGQGIWLSALPWTHIAGFNVLFRSILAGHTPVFMPDGPFTPENFLEGCSRLPAGVPAYISVVPTQLRRLFYAQGDLAARVNVALARFDAVLIGGAMVDPALTDAAGERGSRLVQTYGMAETCGGCVYDGIALRGVRIHVDDSDRRIELAGPMLASGYDGDDETGHTGKDEFFERDSLMWFRTHDLGECDLDGRLRVLGRSDDVIISGGANIVPQSVEQVICELPAVEDCLIVPVPDPQWGQMAVAVIVPRAGKQPTLDEIRTRVKQRLNPESAPQKLLLVGKIPMLPSGKIDRAAIRKWAESHT